MSVPDLDASQSTAGVAATDASILLMLLLLLLSLLLPLLLLLLKPYPFVSAGRRWVKM